MKTLLPCIFLLIFMNSEAQNPQWINYSRDYYNADIEFEGNYVWISTYGGLVRYDRLTNTKVIYNGANSGIKWNNLGELFIDKAGNKWIAYYNLGIVKFDNTNFTDYSIMSNGDTLAFITEIKCDANNNIYILGSSYQNNIRRIFKFNGNGFVELFSPIYSINDFDIDQSGNLWIAENGVKKFDGINWTNYNFPPGKNESITVDTLNNIWVNRSNYSTNSGNIYKFDGNTWKLISPISFLDSRFSYLDFNNHVWIYGYNVNGIYECSDTLVQFHSAASLSFPNAFSYNYLSSFAIDSLGDMWAAFFQEDSAFFHHSNGSWNSINLSSSNISTPQLRRIKLDNSGNKWIATSNGLSKFDGYSFTNYTESNSNINSDLLWSVYVDNSGNIWTCSYDNNTSTPPLAKFDGINWVTYNLNGSYDAFEVIEDNQGTIYVATTNGLAKLAGNSWSYYNPQNSPLPEDWCTSITIDNSQNLWITTYGGGLVKFDGINWLIYNTTNSGLPNNYCWEVFCDQFNAIWISSNSGLTKFDGTSWVTYTTQNTNLPAVPYKLIQDNNGNLWGGIQNGIIKFNGTNINIFNIYNTGICSGVQNLVIDNGNNKWIATNTGGLVVFNENGVDPHAVFNLPNSKFEGNIFHDLNLDGIKDSLEYGLSSQKVFILPDSIFTFSNYGGNYFFAGDTGSYVSELIPSPNWQVNSDSLLYHIQLDTVNLYGYDFGVIAINNIVSVEMELTSYIPRCFTTTNYYITYRNTGTMAVSGTIEFIIDTAVSFITSFPVADSNVNNLYYWDFIDLKPFETRQIIAQLQLPGVAALGDSLHFTTSMIINQTNTASDRLDQEILCAYDPNDKIVEPVGIGVQHLTLKNETFDYVVRFQNTGNDTAFTVFLIDTLSTYLDISFLEFISSSHPCYVTCTSTGTLRFQFENILLPPSETDDPNSNGYVHFRIKPSTNLPDSTVIFNNAFIYFDFNPPIETNTVFNTLVDNIITGSDEIKFNKRSLVIFPNPATDFIIISYVNEDLFHFELYDLYGRLILNKRSQKNSVEISSLNAGIYLYKVILNDDYFTGKLIICK